MALQSSAVQRTTGFTQNWRNLAAMLLFLLLGAGLLILANAGTNGFKRGRALLAA